MNYRFAYAVGFHPWEDAESDPPFTPGPTDDTGPWHPRDAASSRCPIIARSTKP